MGSSGPDMAMLLRHRLGTCPLPVAHITKVLAKENSNSCKVRLGSSS